MCWSKIHGTLSLMWVQSAAILISRQFPQARVSLHARELRRFTLQSQTCSSLLMLLCLWNVISPDRDRRLKKPSLNWFFHWPAHSRGPVRSPRGCGPETDCYVQIIFPLKRGDCSVWFSNDKKCKSLVEIKHSLLLRPTSNKSVVFRNLYIRNI